MAESNADNLIAQARSGDAAALGELLEEYRDRLKEVARRELWSPVQGRVDASDIVQMTFLDAHQAFEQFAGENEQELFGWLQAILKHNLSDAVRAHTKSQKRSVQRERSMDDSRHGTGKLKQRIPSEHSSPSQHAMKGEAALRLMRAMEALPPDQRTAVRMRHFEGRSLDEIARHFGRSHDATASLVKRGLQALVRALELNK